MNIQPVIDQIVSKGTKHHYHVFLMDISSSDPQERIQGLGLLAESMLDIALVCIAWNFG